MQVTTHINHARTRVQAEQEAVDAKIAAFDAFIDRIEDLPLEPAPSASTGRAATGGALARGTAPSEDRCRMVRTAFAETIRPHSVADVADSEPLLETVKNEFSDSLAVALADLGFEALQDRHEKLANHRERCDDLAQERQKFIQQATNQSVDIGVRYQRLIPYLYQSFTVDHPLLATVA